MMGANMMSGGMGANMLSGTFNAFAFAGAGWIFSLLRGKEDFLGETKRHNKAVEDLAKAKEKFHEFETKRNNKRLQLQEEISSAKNDMRDTTNALFELRKFLQEEKLREPKFEDFYQPSEEMEAYLNITVVLAGSGLGLLLFRFV